MSVYIPGMEMPTRCWDCLLNTYGYCMASDKHSDIIPSDAPIPDWCPLIPVPEHGDLIDRDELRKQEWVIDGMVHYFEPISIEEAPAIIPADKEEQT